VPGWARQAVLGHCCLHLSLVEVRAEGMTLVLMLLQASAVQAQWDRVRVQPDTGQCSCSLSNMTGHPVNE
jgi:hypothetical protein